MTPGQIALVQQSFARVAPLPAAAVFYDRVFLLDPALRPLFQVHMEMQAGRFMDMISVVVHGLGRPDTLLPAIRELGVRHVDYGVRPEHYDTVGEALLWTMEQALGPSYTEEVRQAWQALYDLLASTMIDAAYGETV